MTAPQIVQDVDSGTSYPLSSSESAKTEQVPATATGKDGTPGPVSGIRKVWVSDGRFFVYLCERCSAVTRPDFERCVCCHTAFGGAA